jgi:hypothetical protein
MIVFLQLRIIYSIILSQKNQNYKDFLKFYEQRQRKEPAQQALFSCAFHGYVL